MSVTIEREAIASSAQRLFPNLSLEAILARLLLEHAQKNLIRYQTMNRESADDMKTEIDRLKNMAIPSSYKVTSY